jgi:GDPmannose 4,6-dehydratase
MTKRPTIIVTGANGQDGSYMVDYLSNKLDCKIIACMRRTSQPIDANLKHHENNKKVEFAILDLSDAHSISNLVKREKPDYFINFGAQSFVADSWNAPELYFTVNALAVLRALEAIRVHAPMCRFFNAGTSEMFGDIDYSPQDE